MDTTNGTTSKHVAVDSEGLVINDDGTFWVSDEYGPYVWLFDSNGTIISAIRPPEAIIPKRNGSDSFSADSPPAYEDDGSGDDVTPADNPTGRDNNHGQCHRPSSPGTEAEEHGRAYTNTADRLRRTVRLC